MYTYVSSQWFDVRQDIILHDVVWIVSWAACICCGAITTWRTSVYIMCGVTFHFLIETLHVCVHLRFINAFKKCYTVSNIGG